jgi:hypothetical protein
MALGFVQLAQSLLEAMQQLVELGTAAAASHETASRWVRLDLKMRVKQSAHLNLNTGWHMGACGLCIAQCHSGSALHGSPC